MDPLSQAIVGAIVPQSIANRKHLVPAFLIGALAGMSPDLDILIRSETDQLLFLEYHRQFTHSLVFIPFGALLMAMILHPLIGKRSNLVFQQTLIFTTLAIATHGVLDACTSYGTQLFWPFSNMRVSWDNIAIIDPMFTLPLVILSMVAIWKKNSKWARTAVVWGLSYLLLGLVQQERAENFAISTIAQRGHYNVELSAKPTIGNLWLWRTVYEFQGNFFIDSVHVGMKSVFYPGEQVKRFNYSLAPTCITKTSQQWKDMIRFDWFSQNYTALLNDKQPTLIDIRYSLVPNEIDPMWGIRFSCLTNETEHADYFTKRKITETKKKEFFRQLKGL